MCLNRISRIELGTKLAKYDPLYEYLKSREQGYWRASMTEIEKILGSPLPPSAKRQQSWWSNVSNSTHVQAAAWMNAGWETSDVVPGGKVTFTRVNSGAVIAKSVSGAKPTPKAPTSPEWAKPQRAAPTTNLIESDGDDASESDAPTEWFWEGNVVDAVERHLKETGWQIVSKADAASKQRGIDLHAERHGTVLLVEAKGYPSKGYRDPARWTEIKPTSQTNQAQHWFSHALLKAMRLQTKNPGAKVALAFPDFPRYRALLRETEGSLRKLGIAVLFTFESGRIEAMGM